MTRIELDYDQRGTRLKSIGGIELDYGQDFPTPGRLGDMPLTYHRRRLRGIGEAAIEYGGTLLRSRPVSLGPWPIEYGRLGRMRKIGPYDVERDRWGMRVRSVGPMRITFDKLGARPKRVILPPSVATPSSDDLVALYFVLWMHRKEYDPEP